MACILQFIVYYWLFFGFGFFFFFFCFGHGIMLWFLFEFLQHMDSACGIRITALCCMFHGLMSRLCFVVSWISWFSFVVSLVLLA